MRQADGSRVWVRHDEAQQGRINAARNKMYDNNVLQGIRCIMIIYAARNKMYNKDICCKE